MKKEYINEVAWCKIFSFLKKQKNIYIKTEARCKKFMEAIFWMARTGAQWRELPQEYGKWNSIFSRFNDWSKRGIWENLLQFCVHKIHTKVDALRNPLKIIITAGQRSDITQVDALLKDVVNVYVLGDKGYDSKALRAMLVDQGCEPVIPTKSNSKNPYEYDKHIYKERHVIECFFSKIKYFRRVFSHFDKSARNFAALLSFVGVCVWLR